MSAKVYLVPHDFTGAAEAATKHALLLAKQTGATIKLLHIIGSDKDQSMAEMQFKEAIAGLNLSEDSPRIHTLIEKGSIFQDIARIAKESAANLIIMGTHGAKGMQKVFGSYALKVITSSAVPFLVVQKGSKPRTVERITLPVDLTKESMQIMDFAGDLAKLFDSEVHVVGSREKDESLARKISAHITVVRKQLARDKVRSVVKLLDGSKPLHQKVMHYAGESDAQWFALAYHTESLLPQFDRFAQNLLMNEAGLPVLIVNSKEVSSLYF